MNRFRIGRHINIRYGFTDAPKDAHNNGLEIIQIFLGIPTRIASQMKSNEELNKFKNELIKYDMYCVIHGNYTMNFCNPVDSVIFKAGIRSLTTDLQSASIIGNRCLGVIVHMGKNVTKNNLTYEQAKKNYVDGITICLRNSPIQTTIILETGASQGNEIGSTIEKLSEIYHSFDKNDKKRIKFCIDTCHIFATGYDISAKKGVDNFFKLFDKLIGNKNIICIHFNNSRTPLFSKVDRHADLNYGFINAYGLKEVAKFAKKNKIPLVMETPLFSINPKTNSEVTVKEELELVKSWTKK